MVSELQMHDFFLISALAILFLTLFAVIRTLIGPGIINRIVALNMIGTKTIAVILMIGFFYRRVEMFIDIALVYALINFIGTIIMSKYFEKKGAL